MIEPSKIRKIAEKYEDENLRFRSFLKNRADPDELDIQFKNLHNEFFPGYDCCQCNNCCKSFSISVTEEDVNRIAAHLGLTIEDFISGYLVRSSDGYDSEYEIKEPCAFLNPDGKCAIQECKPEVCKEYPHTDMPDRIFSLYSVLSNAEICPVVFEILQRLKKIYGFRSR